MCGACSRSVAVDEWSPHLAGRRDRWEATRLVNDVLRASGHPARVSCAGGPFVVSSGTGRSMVVDTASELWRALLALSGPELRSASVLERAPQTPVSGALAAAAREAEAAIEATQRSSP